MRIPPLLGIGLALLLTSPLGAQNPPLYPFGIDQDNLQGAPDFSFLNHPLTAADRVFVKDGHFYTVGDDLVPNTADDQRIRFYGVNLAFGANFPLKDDAARISRRLAPIGCESGSTPPHGHHCGPGEQPVERERHSDRRPVPNLQ